MIQMLEWRAGIPKDLGRLEKWPGWNLARCSKGKGVHLGWSSSTQQYRLGWPEGRFAEKGLEALEDKWHASQQCALGGSQLGSVSKSVGSRVRQGIILLLAAGEVALVALVSGLGNLSTRRVQVQRRATRMAGSWRFSILGEVQNLTWIKPRGASCKGNGFQQKVGLDYLWVAFPSDVILLFFKTDRIHTDYCEFLLN